MRRAISKQQRIDKLAEALAAAGPEADLLAILEAHGFGADGADLVLLALARARAAAEAGRPWDEPIEPQQP